MSDQMSGTTGGTVRYSVPQASRYLGISERAVRKRIDAGTLTAERDGRRWIVLLPAVPGPEPGGTSGGTAAEPSEPIEAQYRVTPAEIEQAIERTAATYAGDMRAVFERLDELYRDRLADKDKLIAELEQQRDALQGRLSALEAENTELSASTPSAPQTATDAATGVSWWQFWRRRID